ncbi:LNP protein, partial [Atractosteus spatula]|nr:LNP protein [Atractosteus spatula]
MEKETYKTAKLILERFDPDSKKKDELESTLAAGSPVTPRPGQELRQRNTAAQRSAAVATPVTPAARPPLAPGATPTGQLATSAPGGPPERNLPVAGQQGLARRPVSPGPPLPGMDIFLWCSGKLDTSHHLLEGFYYLFQSKNNLSVLSLMLGLHPPGPPLARPILPRERSSMDRIIEYLVGDGPQNRYALICQQCFSHNGMALKEEFEYIAFRCAYCYFLNPARRTRPQAPRLPEFNIERRARSSSPTEEVAAGAETSDTQPKPEEDKQEDVLADLEPQSEEMPTEPAEETESAHEPGASEYVWRKKNAALQHQNLILTVKHGGGSIMVWGCFAASGPGWLAIIEGPMHSKLYQDILQQNVRESVCDLKLKRSWVLRHDNDPKQAVEARHPKNIHELKQFCIEEWAKIPPNHCAGLIRSYRKLLVEVIASSYKLLNIKGSHTFPSMTLIV